MPYDRILHLDFETYYDREYSLSKMPTILYCRDPRFKTLGVAVAEDDGPHRYLSHEEFLAFAQTVDWSRTAVSAYNCAFDACALNVFRRLEQVGSRGEALVWQGHMLDLLRQRPEAVAAYQKALGALGGEMRHDQYGIVLNKAYVEQRLKTPFAGVERRNAPPPDHRNLNPAAR